MAEERFSLPNELEAMTDYLIDLGLEMDSINLNEEDGRAISPHDLEIISDKVKCFKSSDNRLTLTSTDNMTVAIIKAHKKPGNLVVVT